MLISAGVVGLAWLLSRDKGTLSPVLEPVRGVAESMTRTVLGDENADVLREKTQGFFCSLGGGCSVDDYVTIYTDSFGFSRIVNEQVAYELLAQDPGGSIKVVPRGDVSKYVDEG